MPPRPHDVFLSHSSADKPFVEELDRRLTRDGVHCFFDKKSIGVGENWVNALEKAIDACKSIVYVLSPDFCNSEWAQHERMSSMADNPRGQKRKIVPLMLHPCRHLHTFPRFLRHIQSIDVSTDTLFEQHYPRICAELGGTPQPDTTGPTNSEDRTRLPPVHPLPERHWMPFRSLHEDFVGRVADIWNLRDSLFHNGTAVLQGVGVVAGTGGLGKTQLAIEYAHRFGSSYTGGVYWVNAERGLTELLTTISTAAGIDLDPKADEPRQLAQLWRDLHARHQPCLILLDNFPENAALSTFLPTTGTLHTIVTTRRQDLQQATVHLDALSLPASLELLSSGARKFGDSAEPLAERLGRLPLALELAKSYLNGRPDLSISDLLKEMKLQNELKILQDFATEYRYQLPSGHGRDVAATFELSWRLASEPAQKILRVMGELAPTTVPKKLLRLILDIPEQSSFQDQLGRGLRELARLSLTELSSDGDPVAHRLILAFARLRNVADDDSLFDRCAEVVLQEMHRVTQNPDANTIRELESFLPHAEFLISTGRLSPEDSETLLKHVKIQHRAMGRLTAAPPAQAGPSTHVARDKWTTLDALGYFPFAYAIFRFVTDPDTAPPLAISLQAPWGGGKTSLMRMVQAQLDPGHPAFADGKTEPKKSAARNATVQDIFDLIEDHKKASDKESIDVGTSKNRITVWFNAWKYESTDQIWAGLADAIIRQVTARLSPVQRELFFFRLHLKRLDVSKVRKRIAEGAISKFLGLLLRWWWAYLVIPFATYFLQHLASLKFVFPSTTSFASIAASLSALLLVCQWIAARKSELKAPARVELADLVTEPDYGANLGFIHQVCEDLTNTLELIKPASRPLVIFIDDLDRCSPGKISAVVEAINLFLAGEFEHCMFVLGIDDEVVAAALDKAHADVFKQMPAYARTSSIGWRFMDKFVQLPFILPPPSQQEMADYARSLLLTKGKKGRLSLTARQKVATSLEETENRESIDAIVEAVNRDLELDSAQKSELARDAVTIAQMDADIREFNDNETEVTKVILSVLEGFSRNPRDVKRFINSFRFYYFLRSALLTRQADAPTINQLLRWILLSLRWPGIVRWLRSTQSNETEENANGMVSLEQITASSGDHEVWGKSAADLMGLDENDNAWLSDSRLFAFFKAEQALPHSEKLSSSLGKGLW